MLPYGAVQHRWNRLPLTPCGTGVPGMEMHFCLNRAPCFVLSFYNNPTLLGNEGTKAYEMNSRFVSVDAFEKVSNFGKMTNPQFQSPQMLRRFEHKA